MENLDKSKPIESFFLRNKFFLLWLVTTIFLSVFFLVFLSVIWLTHVNTNAEILCLLFAVGIIFTIWKLKHQTDAMKLAEEELKRSEEKWRKLFNILPIGVTVLDVNQNITEFNPAIEKILGLTQEGLLNGDYNKRKYLRKDNSIMPAEEFPSVIAVKDQTIIENIEIGVIKEDGSVIWANVSAAPLPFHDTACVTVTNDITRQKDSLEKLKESEQEFRVLAEAMPQIVWICLPNGSNIYFNQQWIDYTGLTMEESRGTGWIIPFHPEDKQQAWDAWQNAIKNNKEYSLESRLRRFDGTYRWWLIHGVPVLDSKGNILKWIGSCTDINELKIAEAELQKSEERFRTIAESALVGIYVLQDGKYAYVNPAMAHIFGYTVPEMTGMSPNVIVQPIDHGLVVDNINRRIAGEVRTIQYKFKGRHQDGSTRIVEVYGSRMEMNSNPVLIGTLIDITEQTLAEKEINEARRQLEELYRHLNNDREIDHNRISRKIHDELGQSLTALKMDLNWTNDFIEDNLPVKNKITGMIAIVNDIIKKVQHIASELRPAMLDDLGLNTTIEWYCGEFEKRYGIICHLELDDMTAINSKIQLTLYRILQEGLTNIARHAKAKNVIVQIQLSSGKINFKISDDGIGISEKQIISKDSLGLLGIKERLKEFKGILGINSLPNKGTTLVICVPLLIEESK